MLTNSRLSRRFTTSMSSVTFVRRALSWLVYCADKKCNQHGEHKPTNDCKLTHSICLTLLKIRRSEIASLSVEAKAVQDSKQITALPSL